MRPHARLAGKAEPTQCTLPHHFSFTFFSFPHGYLAAQCTNRMQTAGCPLSMSTRLSYAQYGTIDASCIVRGNSWLRNSWLEPSNCQCHHYGVHGPISYYEYRRQCLCSLRPQNREASGPARIIDRGRLITSPCICGGGASAFDGPESSTFRTSGGRCGYQSRRPIA